MRLTWLADALRAEGLTVVEEPGWETRSQPTNNNFIPIGVMNHHTAPPVPYPVLKLYASCNLNIKPTGVVHVVAAGYQYDSGSGSSVVVNEARNDVAPSGTAYERGLPDDINCNPYYIDIEVDHAGDGGPIPDVQLDALILADVAICRHMKWTANRVVAHKESTRRKIDPNWNDPTNEMEYIRSKVEEKLGNSPPPNEGEYVMDPELATEPTHAWANVQEALIENGSDLGDFEPIAPYFPQGADGVPGDLTQNAVREFKRNQGLPDTAIVDGVTMGLLDRVSPKRWHWKLWV